MFDDWPASLRTISTCLLLATASVGCTGAGEKPDDEATDRTEGAAELDVHVAAWNDFHGHIESPAGTIRVDGSRVQAGGAAQLAHHVRAFRDEHEYTATLVAGDLIGASPLVSALFHDEPTIEIMNRLGLDGVAVGNHEFDEGWKELLRIAEGGCHPKDGCRNGSRYDGAEFPYLAANVYRPNGERLFDPWVVEEFDGERVAFVGMALDGVPDIVLSTAVEGLTFENEVETLEALVPKLRDRGIEAIVAVVHEGGWEEGESTGINSCENLQGPIVEIVRQSPDAVDAFLTGHTHKAYNCRIDGTLVTSAMDGGKLVTEMRLTIDRESGDVVGAAATNEVVRADGPVDDEIAGLVDKYSRLAAEQADKPVGRITERLPREFDESGESTLGHLIADAQLAATESEASGGAQFALMNPGGIRGPLKRKPTGDEKPGVVTYGELHSVQPFRNRLVVLTLTGRQIHTVLENQWSENGGATILQPSEGLAYTWHPDREIGDRVDPKEVTVEGEPLQLDAEYRVAVNNFLAQGGDGFEALKKGRDATYGPIDIQALRKYIASNSPVSPPEANRIRRSGGK